MDALMMAAQRMASRSTDREKRIWATLLWLRAADILVSEKEGFVVFDLSANDAICVASILGFRDDIPVYGRVTYELGGRYLAEAQLLASAKKEIDEGHFDMAYGVLEKAHDAGHLQAVRI